MLRYFKEPSDAEPLGSVPVKRIVGVCTSISYTAWRCARDDVACRMSHVACRVDTHMHIQVTLLPAKRKGCRFDLKVDNARVYALDADTPADAKSWVKVRESQHRDMSCHIMSCHVTLHHITSHHIVHVCTGDQRSDQSTESTVGG